MYFLYKKQIFTKLNQKQSSGFNQIIGYLALTIWTVRIVFRIRTEKMNEYKYRNRIPLFGPNYSNSRIVQIIRPNKFHFSPRCSFFLAKVIDRGSWGNFGDHENAKEDQMDSWKLAEIDYLDVDVLEPDLSEEDGLVASARNEDVLDGSLNDLWKCHNFESYFWSCSLELSFKQNGSVVLDIAWLACFADEVKLGGITRFNDQWAHIRWW